jgi:hypothetical protein
MSGAVFDALEKEFPETVAQMGGFFDSHEFILKLAQMHQRLYVAALAAYADHDYPFQIVHGEIARRLLGHRELATKVGDSVSEDIFRQRSSATVWRKAR